jgi:methylmalonyl-CoA mutase C-terminal domain/subunit
MSTNKKIRVLIAKPGLDGHDKGAKIICQVLRDAGMEVIYTGLHTSVEDIVNTAIEEDCDVIGLSILSGAHIPICRKVRKLMEEKGISDKIVIVGGVIPKPDWEDLRGLGVRGIFPMNTPFNEIVDFIQTALKNERERNKKRRP